MQQQSTAVKDQKRREFILNGKMLHVVLLISMPLVVFNLFNYIYGIIDVIIIADMPLDEVGKSISSITMVGQIMGLFTAIGTGMASACGILVSRLIGKNNFAKAKTVSNTLIVTGICVAVVFVAIMLPCAGFILRLCGLPEDLIEVGIDYFIVQVFIVALNIFNLTFFNLEKARGNTKNILYINLLVMVVKISLTLTFVYAGGYGTTMIAVATLIANGLVTVYAVTSLLHKKYVFHFSAKDIMFRRELFSPYLSLAVPIFLGRFVFSFGKVIVNANATHYGKNAPGALGISNHISGSVTSVCDSFQEATSAVISQNIGAGDFKRAASAFWNILLINLVFSVAGVALLVIFNDKIVGLFSGGNPEYHKLISDISYYEKIAIIPLGIASSVMALVYGLGYNKIALIINLSRLLIFRVPVIYMLIYWFPQIGPEALGIAMMVSNCGIGLMSVGVAAFCLLKIKNNKAKDVINL